MKLGLNFFVGQLIALVSILVLFCLGIMLAFYYTNDRALKNNEEFIHEEIEKNRLNQINILVSIARQAEEGFYAEQSNEKADLLIQSLQNASTIIKQVDSLDQDNKYYLDDYNTSLLKSIDTAINRYNELFAESLVLWKQRGYKRDSGLGLKLRNIAYNGLRSYLSLYKTEIIQTLIYRLRWLEYEYYTYGNSYIPKIKTQINNLLREIKIAPLDKSLVNSLQDEIILFDKKINQELKTKKPVSGSLEKYTHKLSEIIKKHTITDFALLVQTLLYYEMEYREFGQQQKHVDGVLKTLQRLSIRINESFIEQQNKKSLLITIDQYQQAFTSLVNLDKDIYAIKIKITKLFKQLRVDIDRALKQEHNSMLKIQTKMTSENTQNTRINFIVSICIIALAIIMVSLMVRRLVKKVKQIGNNLENISAGNLAIDSDIPNESERDELDWINYHVSQVASSLSKSMGELKKQNLQLTQVSSKLSKYLSPQVYHSIFSGQQAVLIQSKRKRLSIFFSDIVSFTNTTENMESEDLTRILNDYLNEMSEIALKHGGTIDKFIGDAIMVFFGDPESKGEKEDCLACVSMAMEMRDKMNELSHRWKEQQGFSQSFQIRMGITSGYCTVGNFGSEERMDYTIIGSQVNLASRLESKAEPNQILISHEAYSLVKEEIECVAMEKFHAKGISKEVQAYQVVNFRQSAAKPLTISVSGDGFSLSVDERKISKDDRSRLVIALKNMINRLG